MIQNQYNKIVKTIRIDDGKEFINTEFVNLLSNLDIVHRKTCVYTPQQNDRVERKHQHLLQVSRAMMFQSSLLSQFYGDSILAATYVINRLPTTVLEWKSPFEVLNSKVPDLSTPKVFGFLCFAASNISHKSKFQPRSYPTIFLGYPHNQKGFRIYDLHTYTIVVSRDVIFHETIFPYKLPQFKQAIASSYVLPIVPIDHVLPNTIPHSEPVYDNTNTIAKTVTVRLLRALIDAKQSYNDHCLFVFNKDNKFVVLIVYVDDILIAGALETDIIHVKEFLHHEFTIKDLRIAKYFIGIQIARSTSGMYLPQTKYITYIIQDLMMENSSTITPLHVDWHLLDDASVYSKLVGRLLYLDFTRPDVTHVVHHLSEFMQQPTLNH
ncbi:hypothetical protein LIER_34093 [Lithospermum erythrorhizon]|uniref:Integrase catalytic domain-containing protein n=1 Tax=Lithospermum erythrorhizon TaxID=34254 RepID=A0AAV3S0Y9_LITER